MTQLTAGKEITCYCNKCKLVLAHTIVVMKNDNTPGKVTCNTCKSSHIYKDQSKTKSSKTKKGDKRRDPRSEIPLAELWQQSVAKAQGPGRVYSTKLTFVVGDLVEHPTFGTGVVDKIIDKTKMEVIFRDNIRTLMHSI